MRIAAASFLCIALLMPLTICSGDNSTDHVLANALVIDHRMGIGSNDLLAMGPKPSAVNTCKCWSCPWDERIYCKTPNSHPDCKWLLFDCNGPRPEECCDE